MTTKEILTQAVTAKNAINSADTETKNKALANMADALLAHTDAILEANKQDVEAARGKIIFGICGGYQMLGENLSDPHGVEAGGTMRGIGLLPVDTVFAEHKTRTQVCGKFLELDEEFAPLKNVEFTGYEIHMGESTWKNGAVASTSTCDTVTGTEKTEGTFYHNVCGTYVHGIFDKEEVALGLVRAVGIRKGIDVSEMEGVDFAAFKETQYDILASELRKHLDMKKIYEILEQGVEDILEESEAEGEAEK